ncbi:MAG TPA: ABC transporter permease [Acidimicrobiales bacterium]|nr:ABC transporter permease [Acidimicrobiales bacterium]
MPPAAGARRLIWVITFNELRRRVRDRSAVITILVAPVAIAAILGFAFAGNASTGTIPIGVSGTSPALLRAAVQASQLPPTVVVRLIPTPSAVRRDVASGSLSGGVVVSPGHKSLSNLLIPMVSPGATPSPGFDIVDRSDALIGQEYAESVAAGLASRLYAGRLHDGTATDAAAISVEATVLGNGGKAVLDYFAPSIAIVFLFIGSGLGMRSLLMERATGTLARLTASPIRPRTIVWGKLLAVALTGLASILIVWGVTVAVFGADWGAPLGVLMMCVGATAAMCGLGVFLTSFARNPQEAFAASLIVGLVLALVGGNLLPPGALPEFFQVLSLGTPNGWALVGFGRLALLRDPASSVVGPFLVLCLIALVTGGLAMTRVRRMVTP